MLRIKILRLSQGLSQWNLAKAVGISQGRYSMLERGLIKATLEERCRLSRTLGGLTSTLFRPAVRTRRRSEVMVEHAARLISEKS